MIDDRLNGDSLIPEDGDGSERSERFAERRATAASSSCAGEESTDSESTSRSSSESDVASEDGSLEAELESLAAELDVDTASSFTEDPGADADAGEAGDEVADSAEEATDEDPSIASIAPHPEGSDQESDAASEDETSRDDESAAEAPNGVGESADAESASEVGSAEADGSRDPEPGDTESIVELSEEELRHAIEAVLFCSNEPVPVRDLSALFGVGVHEIRTAVEQLRDEYVDTGRAFRVEDIAGGVQVLTLPSYDFWIRRLHQKQREGKISAAAFETLAVIAYKQPITKADLENIRGVGCGPTLKTLMDRGIIQVVGRDDSLGRPLLYGTTRRFLESFGLGSLRDLPQPEAFSQSFHDS